jgi:hypothetical protein
MSKPTIDIRLVGLGHLEREYRWWKRIGAFVLAGFAAVALMGQATVSKAAEAKAPPGRATVKWNSVPVYADKATTSKVVSVLKRKAAVTFEFALSGPEGAWCHVTIGKRTKITGYVRCEALKREPSPGWRVQLPGVRVGPEPRDLRELIAPEGRQGEEVASDLGEGREAEIGGTRNLQDLQQMLHRELIEIKEILKRIAQAVKS